jgi:hypothetical protein
VDTAREAYLRQKDANIAYIGDLTPMDKEHFSFAYKVQVVSDISLSSSTPYIFASSLFCPDYC